MNNNYQYCIQVNVTPAELTRFQAAFAETQHQMVELVLKAEQHNGFPAARSVIDRVRKI